ncbi:MAG: hypothetical protein R3E96_17055 [Planctomycetota bacterium]
MDGTRGEVEIGGKPAFVMISEAQMDGVFDQRDSWGLGRTREEMFKKSTRGPDGHAWLDGQAWRPVSLDPHGRSIVFGPSIQESPRRRKRPRTI